MRVMILRDDEAFRDPNRDPSTRRNPFSPENLSARGLPTLRLEAPSQGAAQRISLGFDRDQQQCVFSADIEGQTPVIGYNDLRGWRRQGSVLKKFHPIYIGLRIGSLALHPDDQLVAVRIDTLGGSSPPLLCELGSMNVKLIAPDDCTRQEWLTTLVATANGLLQTVPQPSLDGQPVERVSLLPAAGELPQQTPLVPHLHRIGKVARTLLDEPPPDQSSSLDDQTVGKLQDEYRLFFDYLRGNYKDAQADLDDLASRADTPDSIFQLLALRAQVMHARGMTQQAAINCRLLVKSPGRPECAGLRRLRWAWYSLQPMIEDSSGPGTWPSAWSRLRRCRTLPRPTAPARMKIRSTCGYRFRRTFKTAESWTRESSFSSAVRGVAGSVPTCHPDQEPREWAAAPWDLACSASRASSLRSLRNRPNRAALCRGGSAASAAVVKTQESERIWLLSVHHQEYDPGCLDDAGPFRDGNRSASDDLVEVVQCVVHEVKLSGAKVKSFPVLHQLADHVTDGDGFGKGIIGQGAPSGHRRGAGD